MLASVIMSFGIQVRNIHLVKKLILSIIYLSKLLENYFTSEITIIITTQIIKLMVV